MEGHRRGHLELPSLRARGQLAEPEEDTRLGGSRQANTPAKAGGARPGLSALSQAWAEGGQRVAGGVGEVSGNPGLCRAGEQCRREGGNSVRA